MNTMNPYGYFAKQVAQDLEITTSTLRRWSLMLEEEGYIFDKNHKDQRIYNERDYKALRELKQLLHHSVSMENAVKAVFSTFSRDENASQTLSVHTKNIRFSERELEEYTKRVAEEAAKKAAAEVWEKIDQTIDQKLENAVERQSRILTHDLRQSLEERREIASTKEEGKKGFFSRLFGR